MVGQTIVHYKLLEKLGAGGMGEIYKAEDTRLHRVVAIKVLSPAVSADPERRRRFLQEAQAASALNHPNIITVYDIVAEGDTRCIVMEYVAGQTLREVITPGGLPVTQALRLAVQIASALAVAHAASIIHRDLKPSNVMVTPSGLVKILDFGLAKWLEPLPGAQAGEQSTVDMALTQEGSIIGTVSYMSPEQAEGKRVDLRSDIFAFGSVLYEMLTGRRAFEGTSGISTLSAILRDEVKPIYETAPEVPPLLEQIVLRCLQKDPDARWQSMKEVEGALSTLQRQLDPSGQFATPFSTSAMPAASLSGASAVSAPAQAAPSAPAGRAPVAGAQAAGPPPSSQPPAAKPPGSFKLIPALLGLVGILLVGSAGVGGWLWWKSQHPAASPSSAPPSTPAPVNPAPPPTPPPESANPPAPVNPPPEPAAESKTAEQRPVPSAGKKTAPKQAAKKVPTPPPAAAPPASIQPAPAPQPEKAEQPKAPRPAPAPVVQLVVVKVGDGLPLRILLAEDVPADAADGQPVRFTAVDSFQVENNTVIAKGATITGSVVTSGGKRKILGFGGGKIGYELHKVDSADGKQLSVRATSGHSGEGPVTHSFEVPKGPKKKGFAAVQGTEYIGYIDGDQTVSLHK
ncbi:MAG TPA: serine/threonine-protein kinase [Bryobacteraceae bacterium]|nr:serine/threonine-protein kinase [Bryobacteraceae bacterium]